MTSVSVISIILVGHFSWPQVVWTSFGSEVRSLTVPLKFFTEAIGWKGEANRWDIPTGSSPAHQLQVNWASLRLCRFWWIWVKHPSKWRQLSVLYVPRRQIGSIWLHWSMTSGRWWLCHSLLARSGWGVLIFGDIMWSLTPENPNAWKENSSFVGKHTHTHTQQLWLWSEISRLFGKLRSYGLCEWWQWKLYQL